MKNKIRFNPNKPVWQRWEYVYGEETMRANASNFDFIQGDEKIIIEDPYGIFRLKQVEKRIIGQTKEQLKERVIARGFEWDESEIEYVPEEEKEIIPSDAMSKPIDKPVHRVSYSDSYHSTRITSWKKSHYKY